jgi:hypothetical protein
MKLILVLFLLSLTCQHNVASSSSLLRMELFNGEEKCIGQDFDLGDEAIFKVGGFSSSKHGHAQTLLLTISSPDDSEIINEKIQVMDTHKIREILQTIKEHGLYQMCFAYAGHNDKVPVKIYFGVDFKSKRARIGSDPSKKLGKDDFPSFESELLAAEESLNDISQEIEFARKQEILLTEATEATASRVQWFSIFSMVILVVTSFWQIIYLNHFFKSKKIL